MWDGLKHVASYLRLTNLFRPERHCCPKTAGQIPDSEIAIGLACAPVEHSGIFYRRTPAIMRLLHFADHQIIEDDDPPSQPKFTWVVPPLRPKQIPQIVELCILISNKRPRINYGFRYDEASIFSMLDGSFILADGTLGLTCSTFVLAILRSAGVRLIKPRTWKVTSGSISAQALQVRFMSHGHPNHAGRLRTEIGASRFSPSQVAGSGAYDRHPVSYRKAERAAAVALLLVQRHYAQMGFPV